MVVKNIGRTLRQLWSGAQRKPQGPDFQDLKLKFREFKYLLRANNEVLTVIAEIETHLEGGGVGLDFIRSRYIMASAKVYKMIRHLNRISSDRYQALLSSFEVIRHNIDDVLTLGGAGGQGELVLPLLSVDSDQGHLVGSKAANLAQIGRSGHPICDGFVITTDVFRRVMEHTGLGGQLRQALMLLEDPSYPHLLQMSRTLQEKVRRCQLPPEILSAILEAAEDLYDRQDGVINLSLRSSAIGEDSDTSFAGQYTSVLGVGPDGILDAYREVVASLYSPQAIVYRRKNGLRDEDAEMAVAAQVMLDPVVSGVMYSRDPLRGQSGPLLVSAVYGLGLGLVDGSVTPDTYHVQREPAPQLILTELGAKASKVVSGPNGNRHEPVPPEKAGFPALNQTQVEELARLGLSLEKEFGRPQDVEWALTAEGRFIILQSRPLMVQESRQANPEPSSGVAPLLEGGQTARPGAGAGLAYLVLKEDDLAGFPDGAVLVTRHSSPAFAAVLHRAAAVLTDVGGVTGHMASLAREFGVPALVGAAGATNTIRHGQEITVDAGARRVYAGRLEELLVREQEQSQERARRQYARPPWHRAAQLITPLTLTDPRSPGFAPERCATFHDIIRFVHEKSFQEMFLLGDRLGDSATTQARKMGHKLPFDLWVVDIGGAISPQAGEQLLLADLQSVPGRALMEGLLDPAVHWDRPRPISFRGLASVFSGALLTPPNDGQVRDMGQKAYAIMSADYLNFNSRVGYHFAALDSFCGPNQNDNYLSFRFAGGAATEDRRVLRVELIGKILEYKGYEINRTGDAISAFLKKYDQEATMEHLREMGRLILFTRQMDMLMHDNRMVNWLAEAFISGNYNLETGQA